MDWGRALLQHPRLSRDRVNQHSSNINCPLTGLLKFYFANSCYISRTMRVSSAFKCNKMVAGCVHRLYVNLGSCNRCTSVTWPSLTFSMNFNTTRGPCHRANDLSGQRASPFLLPLGYSRLLLFPLLTSAHCIGESYL